MLSGLLVSLIFPIYFVNTLPSIQEQMPIQEIVLVDDKKETQVSKSDDVYCSCVKTARLHGANIPLGANAWDLSPNTFTPYVGVVILMKYPHTSHVAVIEKVENDGYWVVEGNFNRCELSRRFVLKSYSRIVGFWTA